METIAIYREAIIKTYGVTERSGLCLAAIDLPLERMDHWGRVVMEGLNQSGAALVLLMAHPLGGDLLRLFVLLESLPPKGLPAPEVRSETGADPWRIYPEVDLISIQGPHYGDRYGIASAALKALTDQEVPIWEMICSGASIYLITPPGEAGRARQALGEAFVIPERIREGSRT
jgi:hypothetical protein